MKVIIILADHVSQRYKAGNMVTERPGRLQLLLQLCVIQLCVLPAVCHSNIIDTEVDGEAINPLRNKDFVLDKG